MNSNTIPTTEEILAALAQDPRFPTSSGVERAKDLILLLPGVIGEERLIQKVMLQEYLNVDVAFLRAILATEFDKDFDDAGQMRKVYGGLVEHREAAASNLDEFLGLVGTTMAEARLPAESGFNAEATERYNSGNLTFADLLRTQPSVFLPQPS
jgi:hypothetical protein